MKVWNLPESAKLQAQTLDKLSLAPWRFLRGETNSPFAKLLRPLFDDLADEESYVEVRQSANSINAAGQMVLAIHLNDQRAALWETNLAAVLESLTGIHPTNSQSAGGNSIGGWSLKKHHVPNLIEFAHAGEWVLVGAGENHNALLEEALAGLNRAGAPFPASATNSWLEASGVLSRIASLIGIDVGSASNLPEVSFIVRGAAQYVLTDGEITLPHGESVELEPWNMPTNLIDGGLMSFTAMRGLRPWLRSSRIWTNLQAEQPPDQFYMWALRAFPMETYFAAPLPDASNIVSRVSDRILEKGTSWFATNGLAAFQRSETFNGLSWHGVPYATPFLESVETNGSGFMYGGTFQPELPLQPPPPALLQEILDHTNLVYYDWEITGQRVDQLLYLGQFIRLVSEKAQLPAGSAALVWLRAIIPQLNKCGTEITQPTPGNLVFTRDSSVGLTAIELQLLADWLESPDFPRGLHTLTAAP